MFSQAECLEDWRVDKSGDGGRDNQHWFNALFALNRRKINDTGLNFKSKIWEIWDSSDDGLADD